MFAALALGLIAAGCGDDDEGEDEGTTTAAVEFVGEVDGRDDFLVAVVAEGEGSDRTVRAYICSEVDGVTEFFPDAPAEGDSVALESEDGDTQADVTIDDESASGTISIKGESLDFEAEPATGIGGLYDVAISDDGSIAGDDPISGATTAGEVSSEPTGEEPFVYSIRQTYTAADGASLELDSGATEAFAGEGRSIVIDPDGEPETNDIVAIGAFKGKTTGTAWSGPGD